jgi:hypothetical protein
LNEHTAAHRAAELTDYLRTARTAVPEAMLW